VVDSLGQLTLDEHGHMRWIGGSSTMSLIQSFRAATAAPRGRGSPMADDSGQPNKLYFPAAVFFGKVRALPGPEEVEYPERDLADKLVCFFFHARKCGQSDSFWSRSPHISRASTSCCPLSTSLHS
jgi:hypothetical protein